jgi:L-ascorbate metabolism protein UlaG (beta-lactamase superfamily)
MTNEAAVRLRIEKGGVRSLAARGMPAGEVGLAWLGQAGFAVKHGNAFLLIDPYLSDHLAKKYRGTRFPHVRMMRAPVRPEELENVDWVLCTHRHSDHMDPGSLPELARGSPHCRFLVPAAERETALEMGLPAERVVVIDAGETIPLCPDSDCTAIPSAHEDLKTNDRGEHRFLGYILRLGRLTLYHSGDCVPYAGLAERLRDARIDLALLPVNGRDSYRAKHGVPGNMTFDEAADLCRAAGISWLVPHHFGMFDFNTVSVDELENRIAQLSGDPHCLLPDTKHHFLL